MYNRLNKKISFIGIILVLFLLTLNAAFASMQATVANPAADAPGKTVTGNFVLQDADPVTNSDAVTGINFVASNLVGVTDATKNIPASAITLDPASVSTLADGGSQTVTVNVAIPANQAAQTYQGSITVTGTEGGTAVTASFTLSVVVNSLTSLDVLIYDTTTSLEIVGEEGETGITGTFQMKNTGNTVLSGLSFDTSALDLTDSDNNAITVSFSSPGNVNPGETKTVTATANYGGNVNLDTYGGVVNVKSGVTTLDSFKLDLKVHPEICEDGIVREGDKASRGTAHLQLDIREPDNNDDFKPGDDIRMEVRVDNNDDEDLDVAVVAILYNLDEDEEIVSVESDSEEIKDGDEETIEFELTVPRDFTGDENDRYVMFVKAIEDGDEDNNCNFDSVDLDLKREKDDVIVNKANLNPSIAKPGDIVELVAEIENIGKNDQRDAYVQIRNSELGIDLQSNQFDLDKSGDSDDKLTRRFSINIPVNAAEKDYVIDVVAVDDNDDTYDNGQAFVTLTVKGESATAGATATGKSVNLNVASQTREIDASKKTANLHVLFTSNEASDLNAVIDVKTVGDWAEPLAPQTISLHPGDNNLYFNLGLRELEAGTYSATVTVNPAAGSDFAVKSFTLNFNVSGKSSGLSGVTGAFGESSESTVFWIIGDVVLVLVALLIIKAIFFGRKHN